MDKGMEVYGNIIVIESSKTCGKNAGRKIGKDS